MAEQQEPDPQQTKCSLCDNKHTLGLQDYPGEKTWISLPCGHKVHTHCVFYYLLSYDNIRRFEEVGFCPQCRKTFFTADQIIHFQNAPFKKHQIELKNRQDRVQKLESTNEVFQEEMKEARTFQKEARKELREYTKEVKDLVRRFQDEIRPSLNYVKTQHKVYKQQLKQLNHRRSALRTRQRYQHKLEMLMGTYGLVWNSFIHTKKPHLKRIPPIKIDPFRKFLWKFLV